MKWLESLQKDPDALADYLQYLAGERDVALRSMMTATSWETMCEHRGAYKLLDKLTGFVSLDAQEAKNVARLKRGT